MTVLRLKDSVEITGTSTIDTRSAIAATIRLDGTEVHLVFRTHDRDPELSAAVSEVERLILDRARAKLHKMADSNVE